MSYQPSLLEEDEPWVVRRPAAKNSQDELKERYPLLDWDRPASVFSRSSLLFEDGQEACGSWGARRFPVYRSGSPHRSKSRYRAYFCGKCPNCLFELWLIFLFRVAIIAERLRRPVRVSVIAAQDFAPLVIANGRSAFRLTEHGKRLADLATKAEARRLRESRINPRPGGCSFALAAIETTINLRDRPDLGSRRPYIFIFSELDRQRGRRSDCAKEHLEPLLQFTLQPEELVDYLYNLLDRDRRNVFTPIDPAKKRSGNARQVRWWGSWQADKRELIAKTAFPCVEVKGMKAGEWPWSALDERYDESQFKVVLIGLVRDCLQKLGSVLDRDGVHRHADWWRVYYMLADAWAIFNGKACEAEQELTQLPWPRPEKQARKLEGRSRHYQKLCRNLEKALSGQVTDGIRQTRMELAHTSVKSSLEVWPEALPDPPGFSYVPYVA